MGTGKEQSIQITASSGLSEEEIEKLVKEAEAHAEEDKKKKDLVEARNHADSLIYQTEKSIKELGDKVDASLKSNLEDAMERLKKAMEGTDTEEIKRLSEELMQTSHKLAEAMYQKASGAQQASRPATKGRARLQNDPFRLRIAPETSRSHQAFRANAQVQSPHKSGLRHAQFLPLASSLQPHLEQEKCLWREASHK